MASFAKDFNWDEFLLYDTSKIVRIHDRRLGIFYYTLVFLIMCWVIGFQILYGNEHFQLYDVKGSSRMTIQQPTAGCNPNDPECLDTWAPLSKLPYCEKFKGETDVKYQRPCIFADQHELAPNGMLEGEMFIPTRIDTHIEEQVCDPSEKNAWACNKRYRMQEIGENQYIADIEDFTLLFVHNYYRGEIAGNSLNHQGFYLQCEDEKTGEVLATRPCKGVLKQKKVECLPGLKCGFAEGKLPPPMPEGLLLQKEDKTTTARGLAWAGNEDESKGKFDAFAIPAGDIFRLGYLLELAGLDLDKSFNKEGEPLRESGTIIEILVEYSNLRPFLSTFGFSEVGYVYRVVERHMEELKTEGYALTQPSDAPKHRLIENRHGLLVRLKVGGSFGNFNIVYLLVMLTTSLALLAVATRIVDFMAIYVLQQKELYRSFKYEHTDQVDHRTEVRRRTDGDAQAQNE